MWTGLSMTTQKRLHNNLSTTSTSSAQHTASAKGALFIIALLLVLMLGASLRLEHITEPFFDKFSWRTSSTAMMAENFYRGHWNILYPEVDWGGPGPNYQGREFQ